MGVGTSDDSDASDTPQEVHNEMPGTEGFHQKYTCTFYKQNIMPHPVAVLHITLIYVDA